MQKTIIIILIFIFSATNMLFAQKWQELMNLVNDQINAKEYIEAINTAEKALDIAVNSDEALPLKHAVTLSIIGSIYNNMGEYGKAKEYFTSSVNMKRAIYGIDHPAFASTQNNLGYIYQLTGEYKDAENTLKQSLSIKKTAGLENELTYAVTLNNLAKLYYTRGEYEESEKLFRLALDIKSAKAGTDNPSYAKTLVNYGILLHTLGNYIKAKENIETAATIFSSKLGNDNIETIQAQMHLVISHCCMGNLSEARKIASKLSENLENMKFQNKPGFSKLLYDMAVVNWSMNNTDQAETYLIKAKPLIENSFGKTSSIYASCLNSLGLIKWQKGELDSAYKYLTQVVILRDLFFGENHPEYATSLHNLAGLLTDMKNYKLADKYYRMANDIYINLIEKFFPFLSEKEKTRYYYYLKDRLDMFGNYVMQRQKTNPELINDLFRIQNSIKSIIFNRSVKLRNNIRVSNDNILKEKFNEWLKMNEKLANFYRLTKTEINALGYNEEMLEGKIRELEKDLSIRSKYFQNGSEEKGITLEEISSILKRDEAFVEIIRLEKYDGGWTGIPIYLAMIVTSESNGKAELISIGEGRDFESAHFIFYKKSIVNRLEDNESYQIYWKRINDQIKNKSKIFLVNDGIYHKLNVLTFKPPNGRYLLGKIDINLLSNSGSIRNWNDIPGSINNALLTAFPDYKHKTRTITELASNDSEYQLAEMKKDLESISVPPLPGTKIEVEQIDNLLKANNCNTTIYLGAEASVTNLKKSGNYDLLHIATHGFFLPDVSDDSEGRIFGINAEKAKANPLLRSGLLFSGAEYSINNESAVLNNDDGILTAFDVQNMDLDGTKLVVLSACETGLGEIKNGEGVYGLQRTFKIAGADKVLISLWKISDNATLELMEAFYKNIAEGKDYRDALKAACLLIIKKYKHPYYWGAFVISG